MDRCLPPRVPYRVGVSRLEIAVVIVVLSLFAAVFMPAIQSARENSRRTVCSNNLKQIGLAIHAYAHTYNEHMPPGLIANYAGKDVSVDGPTPNHVGSVGWSWRTMIVRHLDNGSRYLWPDFDLSIGETVRGQRQSRRENNRLVGSVPPGWLCPSDDRPSHVPLDWSDGLPPFVVKNQFGGIAATSYFGNGGSFEETVTHPAVMDGDGSPSVYDGGWRNRFMTNGTFGVNSRITLSDIGYDGTSGTIAVGEVSGRQDSKSSAHSAFYGSIGPNGTLTSSVALSVMRIGEWRVNGARVGSTIAAERGFSSEHPGGANFLFMDVVVRFLSDSTELIPAPSLNSDDPRRHAGCDWAPVDEAEFGTQCARCGSGAYEIRATNGERVGDELEVSREEELRKAVKHWDLNYGIYQRLFSRQDSRW